jgi:carotenoid cleavage dioxygenase
MTTQTATTAPVSPAPAAPARKPLSPADNPVLQGNFAPLDSELTTERLPITGSLPRELAGRLIRTTPNPVALEDDHHWFVGDSMLHAIELGDGQARSYRNRWVRTPHVEEVKGLAAAPERGAELFVQGSGNVNVIGHAGRILALSELGLPWEVTPTLDTVGKYDFAGRLASNMTAHPKLDPKTAELVFFGYDFSDVHLRYHVADASGALVHSTEIATPRPTMMHDFAVTASRVVFMDFPVVFDLNLVAQGRRIPYAWQDGLPARLGVMPRRGTNADVVWIDIDPCYVYHPFNAFDSGEQIVIDVVRHEHTFHESDIFMPGVPPRVERWTIDPKARRVSTQVLDARGQEFPRVDSRVECHPHRYGYAAAVTQEVGRAPQFGNLYKHDFQTGAHQEHDVGPGCAAGEGVFVPVGKGEDEGYVLSVVYDAATHRSHVRVIDAQNFAAPPVARVELPQRVPFGFHGNFIAA